MNAWRKCKPPNSHPPLTCELTLAIACHMARTDIAAGVAVLLAFVCYLRISEIVALKVGDVIVPKYARVSTDLPQMALRLTATKTGPNQWVTVRNVEIACLVARSLRRDPDVSLFGLTAVSLRKRFKLSVKALGLSPDYVPHSLGRGRPLGIMWLFIRVAGGCLKLLRLNSG